MPQLSKLSKSRDDWRTKAVQRAYQLRDLRKTEKRHKQKIVELKRESRQLKHATNKKNPNECQKR